MIRAGYQAKTEPEGTQGQERDQGMLAFHRVVYLSVKAQNCQTTVLL